MAAPTPPLILIVAATVKNGIGKNGGLPWPMLKKEMAYFARVTKRVRGHANEPSTKIGQAEPLRNVVIMGRKTWESIPPKFRPLRDRTNLVITSQDKESFGSPNPNVLVARSIEEGLKTLQKENELSNSDPIGRVFIIGGSSIYEAAMRLPNARHVLLTRVFNDYDCDTHFLVDLDAPSSQSEGWRRRTHSELQDFVGEQLEDVDMEETIDDAVVRYRFTLYERS